jgi:hypothetical protein
MSFKFFTFSPFRAIPPSPHHHYRTEGVRANRFSAPVQFVGCFVADKMLIALSWSDGQRLHDCG